MTTRVLVVPALVLLTVAGACGRTPAAGQTEAAQAAPETQKAAEAPKPLPEPLPDVLARVNGQPVTRADFERLVKNIEGGRGPIPPERRTEVLRAALDQLITYTVLKQEVAARGLTIAEADVEAQMQQMQKQFPNAADFEKALASRNTTVEQLKADARVDMSIDKMMQAELAVIAAATEADAKAFYDKNPDKFEQPSAMRASHILIRVDEKADEATRKAARAKIDSLLAKARAGEDFAALAKQNSDDTSKEQGGDLGFFQRGRMVPPFDQAAFNLKPGEISDVVTTQFGYHIIKAGERKDASTVPYDEVKGQVVEYLSKQKNQERVEGFIEEARKKAKIEVLV